MQQQAKLLSVLQNRQVSRVGSNEAINIDIRLICATNLPLAELADESRFRKDLIYRINTVEILVPPLRKREADIIIACQTFCTTICCQILKAVPGFDAKAIEKLKQYHFPGNVRELQYTMERAVIMSEGETLRQTILFFHPLKMLRRNRTEDKRPEPGYG